MRKHISKIEWGVLLKDVKDVDDLWGVVSSELQTAKNNRYLRKFTKIQFKRSFMVSDTLHNKVKNERNALNIFFKKCQIKNSS